LSGSREPHVTDAVGGGCHDQRGSPAGSARPRARLSHAWSGRPRASCWTRTVWTTIVKVSPQLS